METDGTPSVFYISSLFWFSVKACKWTKLKGPFCNSPCLHNAEIERQTLSLFARVKPKVKEQVRDSVFTRP